MLADMGEMSSHPADQIWSPIGGVTLARYAELTREMAADGIVGPDAIERWVTDRGVAAGSWSEITTGWSSRTIRFTEVRRKFEDHLNAGAHDARPR
jgi:hypothetical protein